MNAVDTFREKLCSLAARQRQTAELRPFSDALMQAFLNMGSETPDNLNCVEHIEVGLVRNCPFRSRPVCGIKLKGKDILVSDVVHLIEDQPIPKAIQEQYPELTPKEWDAITRITTMVLLALERDG